jgi:hypothetical protein
MRHFQFLCFWFWAILPSLAQTDPLTQAHGARSQGMGNVRVHLPDSWTYFNNIGVLDRVEKSEISVGYDHRFGINELTTLDLALAWKKDFGTFGFGISRFGGKLYNQHLLGAGFSNTLGIVSFGVKAEWHQTQIEGFGTGNSFVFSLGGLAELSPQFFMGAQISNLNRAKLSQTTDQRLPTGIQMGISYLPVKGVRLNAEMEKDIEINPVFKAGVEYQLRDWIFMRTGISSNPGRITFGLGLKKDRFGFDYAYGQNTALGRTHHLSLILMLE